MIKSTIKIDGMMCSMCEAHMNDTVRKLYPDCKVSSSHKRKETVIISDKNLDEEKLKKAISDTGYTFMGMTTEQYEKRGLFSKLFS